MRWRHFFVISAVLILAMGLLGGAAGAERPNRLVMGFVPSQNADQLAETAKPLADMLAKELGIPVDAFVSAQYIGLAEAMASRQVDIGFLNSFNYVLTHDQLGAAEVILKSVRNGNHSYRAQFFTRAGSGIESVADLKGKTVAFVDAASTSGYLFPVDYMMTLGIDPDTDLTPRFVGGHDNAILAVYRGDVDAGVSFEDARTLVVNEYPDVMEKVQVIGYTDWIPNDTVSVRPGLDVGLALEIQRAFLRIAETPEGVEVLRAIYNIDGFAPALDSDYDVVRRVAAMME